MDRSGAFLLAACQDSNAVASFSIDRRTGVLRRCGGIDVPAPVCLAFMERRAASAVYFGASSD
jgi:6-phosphogluconolactonase (cycloisomerase 2 family)